MGMQQNFPDDSPFRSQYEMKYEKPSPPDNYGLTMLMFVDEDGRLFVVAAIYTMAGAERYEHILEILAE